MTNRPQDESISRLESAPPVSRAGYLLPLERLAVGAVAVAFCLLYFRPFLDLAGIWLSDENVSHSLLLLPIIAWVVWSRRDRLAALPRRPSPMGLVLVIGSLVVLLVGTAGVEFFLMRVSAIGVVVGVVLYLAGWGWLRALLFPIGLAALVIPIPPVLFYQLTFPLQVMATKFGVAALQLLGIPVFREGNVISLAHTTLEVTEACSGIRSLLSLFTLAVLYGYFTDPRLAVRIAIALSSIPIAIIANGLRIAGTGVAAHYISPSTATGFFHAFSGWTMFLTSAVMLMAVTRALRMLPDRPRRGVLEPVAS